MYLDIRAIESTEAAEIFITATPQPDLPVQKQAEEIFISIKELLQKTGAWILEERVFATDSALEVITLIRKNAYGDLDYGVDPTYLVVSEGMYGEIAGVQVHAVRSRQKPEVLYSEGTACGRVLHQGGKRYIVLSGISASEAGQALEQARAMFKKAESALKQVGGNMLSVVRTWVWLEDILSWYKDFNSIRTQFFIDRGLIKGNAKYHLPASTGIGVAPAGGAKCALDLFAVIGAQDSIKFLIKGGEQGSAFEYGSAFSRASRSVTPAGETVFVSGTASVSPDGATEHVGDIRVQIMSTISHVQAILKDMDCKEQDVVQMVAYCKNEEVEKVFSTMHGDLPWPRLTVIANICREDLLFEIDVTACPGAHHHSVNPTH